MTVKTTKKSAVKGTVAAAAGVAVLLGGMGTFALWNQSGSIGTTGTGTGHLTATFGDEVDWKDVTPGGDGTQAVDPDTFKMVPGDVLEGTTTVVYDVEGENIVVKPELQNASGVSMTDTLTYLSDSALTVKTTLVNEEDTTVDTLKDGDNGTLTAKVTIKYDQSGVNGDDNANMNFTDMDLTGYKFVLQQQTPADQAPAQS